jgi:hypothetical protein
MFPTRPSRPGRAAAALLLGLCLLPAAGCRGRGALPPTYPAGGSVVYRGGQPFPGGTIEFVSLTDPSVAVSGEIQDDGTFALHTLKNTDRADGAAEGSYRVTVLPRLPADQKPVRPLTLAATYKVEPKENVFRIEIDPGRRGS